MVLSLNTISPTQVLLPLRLVLLYEILLTKSRLVDFADKKLTNRNRSEDYNDNFTVCVIVDPRPCW